MRTNVFAAAMLVTLFVPDSAAPSDDKKFEQCKAKLVRAQQLGVLYAFDWKPPKEPYVVVGATFFGSADRCQGGFADAVNCFLMAGETGKCTDFDVLHWQSLCFQRQE